jgi:HK97 family phage prohead protease
MRIELRSDSVKIEGYVNAVERDSRVLLDQTGERFVEQIRATTFSKALEKSDVDCLLNHDKNHKIASTIDGSLELYEDNIGLRAVVVANNADLIDKARGEKLRGWSFGFSLLKSSDEPIKDGFYRRFVEDMNLHEVSIIDERAIPCYIGTSIETRANTEFIEYRAQIIEPKIVDKRSAVFDFNKYEKILEDLKNVRT